MSDVFEVSVLCLTYNQESYIRKALDSILSQRVLFKYELVIHDDASTDKTSDIVREYKESYPDIINLIRSDRNKYSRKISFINTLITDVCKGKYVAICEGDDYWIDDEKLQRQYDALEAHPENDMCACWGCTVTEDGEREVSQIRPIEGDGILSMEETIIGGGQYLVTAGLFFRRKMCEDMLGLSALDYSWQMRGAMRGGIVYLDRKMAVYRRYAKGSWTNNVLAYDDKLRIQWEREKKLLEILDTNTHGKYHDAIVTRLRAYTPFETQLDERRQEVLGTVMKCERPCYIWGLGRRGRSLEAYLKKAGISVDGVCDAVNTRIGEIDEYGNAIKHTEYVLKKAATILASTEWAYKDLVDTSIKGKVINLQQYMPYG